MFKVKRSRLKRCAALLLTVIMSVSIMSCGNASGGTQDIPMAEKQIFAMDTVMDIRVYGKGAQEAAEEAGNEITRLDRLFSIGNAESDISKLNETGDLQLSDESYYLIKKALEIGKDTDGAFDISILPVMEAWGFTTKEYRVPAEDELKKLIEYVDYSKITLNDENNEVRLADNMKIDLGGIAKGYTAERIVELLREKGIESAMINLGGNAQALGKKPDGSLWRIGVQDPGNENGIMGVLEGSDIAVVTSGGYERYFEENGKTYHHIIDPETGHPVENGTVSVTIVTKDGTLADGLSTSLFVMGLDRAEEFWRSHSDVFDFIIQDDSGKLYVTKGLEESFASDLEVEYIE